MAGVFIKLVATAAVGAAGWWGFQKWRTTPDPAGAGRTAMVAGNYDHAVDELEAAAVNNPDDLTIQLDLAECYDNLGRPREAAACYRRAEPLFRMVGSSVSRRRHSERYEVLKQKGY